MLDRVTSGVGFLVHSPGTVEPGHHHKLPFLKLDIYVPAFLFQENLLIDHPIASMVQTFAEEAALPVTRRWRRAFESTGQSLHVSDSVEVSEAPSSLPVGIYVSQMGKTDRPGFEPQGSRALQACYPLHYLSIT